MNTNRAWKLAVVLRRRYDLPGPAVAAIRRCLLTLGDERAADALALVEARGAIDPLFVAVKRLTGRKAKRRGQGPATTPPAGVLGRAAAEELAREWAPVLGLSYTERSRLREAARRLGEDATRDLLADALEEGADPLGVIDRLAA